MGVREEYSAAKFCIQQVVSALDQRSALFDAGIANRIARGDLDECLENLEITYLLRLFAEFEGVLRDYWLVGRNRTSRPDMKPLMISLAAYCQMNADDINDAHAVREYRNRVIHNHQREQQLDFSTALSRLNKVIRWLPKQW
jgi:hypothetical protein